MLAAAVLAIAATKPQRACAQESPYFVTYDHHLEDPGDLEIEFEPVTSRPRGGNRFMSGLIEFEYGVTSWWTSELYLEGQSTHTESAIFSGYRIENRFRPLSGSHWINPVLYAEFADTAADRTLKEVVGFDTWKDALTPNGITRRNKEREVETRLILSSDFKGWNISENFIGEKKFAHEPWEFGYSAGVSRRLGRGESSRPSYFFKPDAGFEIYGGLGTADRFTLATSHYAGPIVAWHMPGGIRVRVSPGFGLNRDAYPVILRFGVSCELEEFGPRIGRLFRNAF
ncbi:MAG: hypothetical protein KGM47_06015 [Acidobacteriota bacterium]|nr:hypothetical protein [Acidobacteriota bacterium]